MIRFHKLVSTVFGIGYLGKGGGTVASSICCFAWWLLPVDMHDRMLPAVITLLIISLGIWSAGAVEKIWGKDNQRIVVDEWAGMCVALLWIPLFPRYILPAFLLFRFFDIVKPLFIKRLEKLPGGWGVMFDDLLAGLYTNLLLQLVVATNFF
jgi:phosphatidylglycerophosphatase A